jgi:putative PIN family toxin of toxin-antitoxin system
MVKAAVDTNVLVSATLFGGNPEKILDSAREGKIELIISEEVLKEFEEVLKRKFGFSLDMAELTASDIKEISSLVIPTQKVDVVKEKEADNRILECGVEGKANYIVSGDKHLLTLKEYKGMKILSPAQFLRIVSQEISSRNF